MMRTTFVILILLASPAFAGPFDDDLAACQAAGGGPEEIKHCMGMKALRRAYQLNGNSMIGHGASLDPYDDADTSADVRKELDRYRPRPTK